MFSTDSHDNPDCLVSRQASDLHHPGYRFPLSNLRRADRRPVGAQRDLNTTLTGALVCEPIDVSNRHQQDSTLAFPTRISPPSQLLLNAGNQSAKPPKPRLRAETPLRGIGIKAPLLEPAPCRPKLGTAASVPDHVQHVRSSEKVTPARRCHPAPCEHDPSDVLYLKIWASTALAARSYATRSRFVLSVSLCEVNRGFRSFPSWHHRLRLWENLP